jgi:hypothetical protein
MGTEGIYRIYKVSYLYSMDYICKNKNLKTIGQHESHNPSPMMPACVIIPGGWPLGMHETGNDA